VLRRVQPQLQAAKAAFRAQVRLALSRLPADARLAASRQLVARLCDQPCWATARRVLLFAPLADEPDIWPLVDQALLAGKTVALPKFAAASGEYVAAVVQDRARDLRPGRFGILEPLESQPRLPLGELDLVLVPGVAFDPRGRRLGRGKGYYDRLLPQARGIKCGVAFDLQIVPELPAGPRDSKVDYVLTPTRWLTC